MLPDAIGTIARLRGNGAAWRSCPHHTAVERRRQVRLTLVHLCCARPANLTAIFLPPLVQTSPLRGRPANADRTPSPAAAAVLASCRRWRRWRRQRRRRRLHGAQFATRQSGRGLDVGDELLQWRLVVGFVVVVGDVRADALPRAVPAGRRRRQRLAVSAPRGAAGQRVGRRSRSAPAPAVSGKNRLSEKTLSLCSLDF